MHRAGSMRHRACGMRRNAQSAEHNVPSVGCSLFKRSCGGCLKIAGCYDIPPFRQTFEIFTDFTVGTWNRRNNSKNNGSMSSSSCVASRRWNVVFVAEDFLRQPRRNYFFRLPPTAGYTALCEWKVIKLSSKKAT